MTKSTSFNGTIDVKENKFPYCVVFAYLPCISTFLPSVGHVGICTSDGLVHDFAGSHCISIDRMAFSDPIKYWKLDKSLMPLTTTDATYDEAIALADEIFAQKEHNLFKNNCHHHVAMALNNLKYKGRTDWTPFKIFLNLILHGKFVTWKYFLVVYGPFTMLLALIVGIIVFFS